MKKKCPEEEILGDYLEKRLSDEERSRLETYLAECDECLEELLVVKNLIKSDRLPEYDPVSKRVTEGAIHLLADRIPVPRRSVKDTIVQPIKRLWSWIANLNSLKLYSNTGLAHVRSHDLVSHCDGFRTKKSFEKIETEIEIEKTSNDRAVIRVHLISDAQNQYNIRVTLLNKDQREISSFLLNGGYVVFEDIYFDHYSLVFIRNGAAIGTYPFEIKGTYHGECKNREERTSNR
jgi:hypothetical protein